VVILSDDVKLARSGRLHVPTAVTAVLLLLIAVVLAYLGWVLPDPGGSLAIPTLIVFGIGSLVALAIWIVTGSIAIAMTAIGLSVVASVWTFEFSMPAKVAWGSSATAQAQAVLLPLATAPRNSFGVVPEQCSMHLTGSVGPLAAPYRECALSTPEGSLVRFTATRGPIRGLGYTDLGGATFPDECSRHLTGQWWMFTGTTSGTGDCPIGYQFNGGP
jgi:hypothetical protein